MHALCGWLRRGHGNRGAPEVTCFHCGKRVSPVRAVQVRFDGQARMVCCHGCATVLQTVEQFGAQRQYLEQRERRGDEK